VKINNFTIINSLTLINRINDVSFKSVLGFSHYGDLECFILVFCIDLHEMS